MSGRYLLGFDIGGTKCAAILGLAGDDGISVVARRKFATADAGGPRSCVEIFKREMRGLMRQHRVEDADVAGLGISAGGPLDSRAGMILSPPNLPGWDEVPVKAWLEEEFDLPIHLQNDANAGAVAEWRYGAGRGVDNLIFLTFGTGLGAGLILGGRLYAGACDMAGEAGHIRLASHGPVGYGKAGSFEGFCSGGGIAQLARTRALEVLQSGGRVSWCTADTLGQVDAKLVGDAAEAGDELARSVYAEVGTFLGRGLAVLVDILNPDLIVIGSIFARSENLIRPTMELELAREALPHSRKVCRVAPAQLGESIGDLASLTLADGRF